MTKADASQQLAATLEEQRRLAMLQGDVDRLRALLAPQLYYRHSTGTLDGRDSLLAKLAAGALKYQALEFSIGGHSAAPGALVVHGDMTAQVLRDSEVRPVNAHYLASWMFRDTWQLVAFQGLATRP